MDRWLELVAIAESISHIDDCDAIVWVFDGSSKFSVQAVYKIIGFRGVQSVYTPSIWNIWNIVVPPWVHIFMWLLTNNKILTGDNLAKRRTVEDATCVILC